MTHEIRPGRYRISAMSGFKIETFPEGGYDYDFRLAGDEEIAAFDEFVRTNAKPGISTIRATPVEYGYDQWRVRFWTSDDTLLAMLLLRFDGRPRNFQEDIAILLSIQIAREVEKEMLKVLMLSTTTI